jgi:hypothetical protein
MHAFRSANRDENGPTKDSNLKPLNIASSVQHPDELAAFRARLVVDNDLFYGETASLTPKFKARFPKARLVGVRFTSCKQSLPRSS